MIHVYTGNGKGKTTAAFGLALRASGHGYRVPDDLELVLTGRYASERLMEKSDLVTDMCEVKHYYSKGIGLRNGIEN